MKRIRQARHYHYPNEHGDSPSCLSEYNLHRGIHTGQRARETRSVFSVSRCRVRVRAQTATRRDWVRFRILSKLNCGWANHPAASRIIG